MEAAYYEVDDVENENSELMASGVAAAGSSVTAVVETTAGFGSVVGNIAATASFDSEFKQERAKQREQIAGHAVNDSIESGFTSLGRGLFEGVTGLVTKPIDGAIDGGPGGFIKGLGKGAAGLFAKPLAGVSDVISGTAVYTIGVAEGLHSSRRHEIYLVRPARHVPEEGTIQSLCQPNKELTAVELEIELPIPRLKQHGNTPAQEVPWLLQGQPGVLPISDVIVVGAGEPRGEYSIIWSRTTGETAMLEAAEDPLSEDGTRQKRPLAIGIRRSLDGDPTISDIALVKLSDLQACRRKNPRGQLPWGFKAIEQTPGGRAAVFMASVGDEMTAVVLCKRCSSGAALTDIQVLPEEGIGLPPTHCRISQTLLDKQHCSLHCARGTMQALSLSFWRHEFLFDRRKLGFSAQKMKMEDDLVCNAIRSAPITQVMIINPNVDNVQQLEQAGYTIVWRTPAGSFADLNAGCPGKRLYVAFRRGHGEPITAITVIQAMHEAPPQGDGWTVCFNPRGEAINLNQGNNGVVLALYYRVGNSALAPISQIGVIRSDGYLALGKTQRDKEALPTGYSMVRETPTHRSANTTLGTSGHGMFLCYKRLFNGDESDLRMEQHL